MPQSKLTLDNAVKALDAKETNGEWLARCVFPENHQHGDKNPSLVISEDRGKLLFHCRGGCEQQKVYDKARSLVSGAPAEQSKPFTITQEQVSGFAEALEKSPEANAWLKDRGISIETAQLLQWGFLRRDWKDEQGNIERDIPTLSFPHYRSNKLVALKLRRIDSKKHIQFPGSSNAGLYASSRTLDPLADEVFVFEGPPDVALAMSHGFNSTGIVCADSELSNRDIGALSQYKRIYLVGDQDLVGKKAMDDLEKRLPPEKVIRVRLTGFKDIGDLYRADPAKFEVTLQTKIRLARASRKHFDLDDLLTDTEDLAQMQDATPEIVEKLIPTNAITMLFGEEKSGKSLLAYYILKCIANGSEVFGTLKTVKRPVLYLDRENSNNDIAGMLAHFARIGEESVHLRNRITGCPDVDDPQLLSFCEKRKPVLVFDSLTKFLKTQANGKRTDPFNPAEMSELFDKLLNLCAAGATVIIIHHTKKESDVYANSHQIGANVTRAFLVTSLDRPRLNRVRLEGTLSRGAEPVSFNLIGFPCIQNRGMFGLADPSAYKTDKRLAAEWVQERYPDGCIRQTIKDEWKGMSDKRKNTAVSEALADGLLLKNEATGILTANLEGSQRREPPVASTSGSEGRNLAGTAMFGSDTNCNKSVGIQ